MAQRVKKLTVNEQKQNMANRNVSQPKKKPVSSATRKKRETVKGALQAAVRVGTLGYSAMAEEAVKKARAKKTK